MHEVLREVILSALLPRVRRRRLSPTPLQRFAARRGGTPITSARPKLPRVSSLPSAADQPVAATEPVKREHGVPLWRTR
jgi:hypothetical protein